MNHCNTTTDSIIKSQSQAFYKLYNTLNHTNLLMVINEKLLLPSFQTILTVMIIVIDNNKIVNGDV